MRCRVSPLLDRPECLELMWKMYSFHGFSYRDLAIAFNCSVGVIGYRLSKELYKLRKQAGNIWIK